MKRHNVLSINFFYAFWLALTFTIAPPAYGDTIIAPDLPMYTINSIPFGGYNFSKIHYQQVYSSSLFTDSMNIYGLSFWVDLVNMSNYTAQYNADITIRLGYTTADPGFLDTVNLSNNASKPLTKVFKNEDYSSNLVKYNWDINFDFSKNAFYFDNTQGYNLIIDIQVSNQTLNGSPMSYETGWFASARVQDGITSGRAFKMLNTDGTWVTGGNDQAALMTLFSYSTSPVPEPATALLFGAGIAGLAAVGRKKSS